MNEDEHGVTPAKVTAITVEAVKDPGWLVTIERGNGGDVQLVRLTDLERVQLAGMMENPAGLIHAEFVDVSR
jgi:hypothetical protein